MPSLAALVSTDHASRYLQQLCKHWSHRFEVVFDADTGVVPFPNARLDLAASPSVLKLRLEGPDAAELDRLGDVVAQHVRRFAFREELTFDWRHQA